MAVHFFKLSAFSLSLRKVHVPLPRPPALSSSPEEEDLVSNPMSPLTRKRASSSSTGEEGRFSNPIYFQNLTSVPSKSQSASEDSDSKADEAQNQENETNFGQHISEEHEEGEEEESHSGSDSRSSSESDSPPENVKVTRSSRAGLAIKPNSSEPMDQSLKAKKASTASDKKRQAAAVLAELNGSKGSNKRQKKTMAVSGQIDKQQKASDDEGNGKKNRFQRCFSLEDEISILKGIIEFMKRGSDPVDDFTAFYESIKKSLHFDASRNQLGDKVRHLKRKYMRKGNGKAKRKGNSFSSPNEHEKILYDLSNQIWGRSTSTAEGSNKNHSRNFRKKKEKSSLPESNGLEENEPNHHGTFFESLSKKAALYPFLYDTLQPGGVLRVLGMEDSMAKKGFEAISSSDAKYLDEKWMKLQLQEVEICIERAELAKEQAGLFFSAVTSGL